MVVIPIRSFRDGKTRLAAIDPGVRVGLVQQWAETVVRAAHDLPVVVVTDDADVEAWADTMGVGVVAPGAPGLDAAARAGRDEARRRGVRRMMVAHADLPLAADLRPVADVPSDVVVVTDRAADGTNVIALPTDERFGFAYGAGSFRRHRAEAARLGWTFTRFDAPELSHDVDGPDDLDGLPGPARR